MGNEFKALREEFRIRHITCPVYDHRGNGKVEKLIRTINERLRANPELLVERQNKLIYQLVSALRVNKGKDGKSPFERHTEKRPNTKTSIIVKLYKELNNLDFDKSVQLDKLEEFPRDDDSTIFVKERQRKGKLAGLFKRRKGKITGETRHTVTFAPENKQTDTVLSKREVAIGKTPNEKRNRKQAAPKRAKHYAIKESAKNNEETAQVFADLEQDEEETQQLAGEQPTARMRRNRRAPDRYGLPVYICGVEKKPKEKK